MALECSTDRASRRPHLIPLLETGDSFIGQSTTLFAPIRGLIKSRCRGATEHQRQLPFSLSSPVRLFISGAGPDTGRVARGKDKLAHVPRRWDRMSRLVFSRYPIAF